MKKRSREEEGRRDEWRWVEKRSEEEEKSERGRKCGG